MHTRRILLAFSLAASAASVAFADYQTINQSTDSDRLEQLSKTLSQGSYTHPDDLDLPASAKVSVTLRQKTVELNNESLAKKYGNTSAKNSFNASSNFGGRTMSGRAEHHGGLDMAAPSGTPIYATGPGIVTKSGWGTGYGQYVEINHGNGYLTRYAHASRLMVRVGDQVSAGEHIANVGCTGRCTGPHLHYEVVKDGQRT
ncbi:M23 family metallopeptidase, partial [Citrobacter freundii]|uniref:M23 family metallopeptidase n=1 Tax=Citrobacter freundii TaxID=546 RepID=UPI0021CAD4D8